MAKITIIDKHATSGKADFQIEERVAHVFLSNPDRYCKLEDFDLSGFEEIPDTVVSDPEWNSIGGEVEEPKKPAKPKKGKK